MFCFLFVGVYECRCVKPQAVLKITDSLDFWVTCSIQCLVNDQEDPWKSEHWMAPSFLSFTLFLLIIREFGSHMIPLSKFASAILSSAYSTKAIALVSVKCRRTRYLRLVSALPAIDGSQHCPNLIKQREEKSGTQQSTAPRKGSYSRAGAWKLNSHCEIMRTSFLDQSRWYFCPTYLIVARGNRVSFTKKVIKML